MKITGDRSSITIELNGKTLKISGELTTTPAFYADKQSIKNYLPPYDNIQITELEKNELIETITIESKKPGNIPIIFE